MLTDAHGFVLRFQRRYSMAHRLVSGEAPNCRVPHGHDEVVEVEIAHGENGPLDAETNMLVEFSRIKGRWFGWIDGAVDHSFHLGEADPLVEYFRESEVDLLPRLLLTPGDPTTEIRAACFARKLGAFLAEENPGFACLRLSIRETPTNSVDFYPAAEPEGLLAETSPAHWWNRADNSINDLAA